LKLDKTPEKKSSTRGQHIWMESKDTPMMGGCWVVTVCAQPEKKMIGEGTENCVEMDDQLQPTIEVFSLFAVATSYIGFTLGLSDFLCDCKLTNFLNS
jgi:hypothetical protein